MTVHGYPLAGVQFAFANPTTNGNTLLVPAQSAGLIIRVTAVVAIVSAAASLKFVGSLSGDVSAKWPLQANGGFVLPGNEYGWFQTAPGESLSVNLDTAVNGGIQISWLPIKA